jgi:hypothetical protein
LEAENYADAMAVLARHPSRAPIKGLLARWLRDNKADLEWVARAVDAVNDTLPPQPFSISTVLFRWMASVRSTRSPSTWNSSSNSTALLMKSCQTGSSQ